MADHQPTEMGPESRNLLEMDGLELTRFVLDRSGSRDYASAREAGAAALTNPEMLRDLLNLLYKDGNRNTPVFPAIEPPKRDVAEANLLPPVEKSKKLDAIRDGLNARINGLAILYAQGRGQLSASLEVGNLDGAEMVLTALPDMAMDREVAVEVTNTANKVLQEKGAAGLVPNLDNLRRMTTEYSGISRHQPDKAGSLKGITALVEGFAAARDVREKIANPHRDYIYPSEWNDLFNKIFGDGSNITRYLELNYRGFSGRSSEPNYVGRALIKALHDKELASKISEDEKKVLELVILGCAEHALDHPRGDHFTTGDIQNAADLIYGVCGEKTWAEATSQEGTLSEQLKRLADKAGDKLNTVDPKFPLGTSNIEAFMGRIAPNEQEKKQQRAEAQAQRRQMEEEARRAAEEEEKKNRIEEEKARRQQKVQAMVDKLKEGLDPNELWEKKKIFLLFASGEFEPTERLQKTLSETARRINELRNQEASGSGLTTEQKDMLNALEQFYRWLTDSRPKSQ